MHSHCRGAVFYCSHPSGESCGWWFLHSLSAPIFEPGEDLATAMSLRNWHSWHAVPLSIYTFIQDSVTTPQASISTTKCIICFAGRPFWQMCCLKEERPFGEMEEHLEVCWQRRFEVGRARMSISRCEHRTFQSGTTYILQNTLYFCFWTLERADTECSCNQNNMVVLVIQPHRANN